MFSGSSGAWHCCPNPSGFKLNQKKIDTVILHAGVNNIRLRQSEILKKDFSELVEVVRNVSPATRILISGPLPTYRRGN